MQTKKNKKTNNKRHIDKLHKKTIMSESPTIRILASFTAAPLEPVLNFWAEKLPLKPKISFATYNQVIQELLNPNSKTRLNRKGINVIFIRLEDTYRYVSKSKKNNKNITDLLNEYIFHLLEGLTISTSETKMPHLLILCPCSLDVLNNKHIAAIIHRAEEKIKTTEILNTYFLTQQDVLNKYSVSEIQDPIQEELGHITLYTTILYGFSNYGCAFLFFSSTIKTKGNYLGL